MPKLNSKILLSGLALGGIAASCLPWKSISQSSIPPGNLQDIILYGFNVNGIYCSICFLAIVLICLLASIKKPISRLAALNAALFSGVALLLCVLDILKIVSQGSMVGSVPSLLMGPYITALIAGFVLVLAISIARSKRDKVNREMSLSSSNLKDDMVEGSKLNQKVLLVCLALFGIAAIFLPWSASYRGSLPSWNNADSNFYGFQTNGLYTGACFLGILLLCLLTSIKKPLTKMLALFNTLLASFALYIALMDTFASVDRSFSMTGLVPYLREGPWVTSLIALIVLALSLSRVMKIGKEE